MFSSEKWPERGSIVNAAPYCSGNLIFLSDGEEKKRLNRIRLVDNSLSPSKNPAHITWSQQCRCTTTHLLGEHSALPRGQLCSEGVRWLQKLEQHELAAVSCGMHQPRPGTSHLRRFCTHPRSSGARLPARSPQPGVPARPF